ncbi:hypothetical protein ACSU1N_03975 [Thermogladius sp. 4427co]|uniref:hypothetical protein n=1 Tax=Thermogladius sp. 4427co TaxID=3450718 RepID=UPI003F78C408
MISARDLLGFILSRTGCLHPFRVSRIIALAEIRWLNDRGSRLTSLVYRRGPGVFYIEGLKEMLEGDPCFVRREGVPGVRTGCVEYVCGEPSIPEDVRQYIEGTIKEAVGLGDTELNDRVVKNPLFARLLS